MAMRNNYVKNAVSPILSVKKCSSTQKCRCKKFRQKRSFMVRFLMILCGKCGTLCIFRFNVNIIMSHIHTAHVGPRSIEQRTNERFIYRMIADSFIEIHWFQNNVTVARCVYIVSRNSQIKHTTDVSACLSHNECVLPCFVFIIGVTVLAVSFHWPKFMQKFPRIRRSCGLTLKFFGNISINGIGSIGSFSSFVCIRNYL